MGQSRRKAITLGAVITTGLLSTSIHPFKRKDSNTGTVTKNTIEEPEQDDSVQDSRSGDDSEQNTRPGVVDVRDYGAKGDGRTDDSTAIEDAIKAAESGDIVFLPETSDSYLISFDGEQAEAAISIGSESNLDGITIMGETTFEGAQTLQVEPGSYDPTTKSTVIRIQADQVIKGLSIHNLTIDGARPDDDRPAGLGGEAALTGINLSQGDANGGHEILIEDCVCRDCSANAFRFEESGVTCRYVTARRAGRHGFNPVAADTTVNPGFVGEYIKAIDCDGTGIDHRRGTAKLRNVYTENNRSGNKWKHHVKRLEVINHHSVNDQNHGWRSNHSKSNGNEYTPESQEIVFNRVSIENPVGAGLRISGTDTNVKYDLRGVEVRSATPEPSEGAIKIFRDAEMITPGTGHAVVVGTENGVGISVLLGGKLDIGTYEHFANDRGALNAETGEVHITEIRNVDPGRNVFRTIARRNVGAFTKVSSGL